MQNDEKQDHSLRYTMHIRQLLYFLRVSRMDYAGHSLIYRKMYIYFRCNRFYVYSNMF